MRHLNVFVFLAVAVAVNVFMGCGSGKYEEVASFTDKGRNRAYFIALKGELSSEELNNTLQEIVDTYMEEYGIAPQMWIFFFDDKKYTPKDFPIEGEALDHLVAKFFWATDTRRKDLQIFTEEEKEALKKEGTIESPLWEGQ